MVDTQARERERQADRDGGLAEQLASAQAQLRKGKRPDQLGPEDQGALLRQRLEREEVSRELVDYAAELGHPAAAHALGREPGAAPSGEQLPVWLQETSIPQRGWRSITLAFTRCATRELQGCFRADDDDDDDDDPESPLIPLLEAVEAWMLGPLETGLEEAVGASFDQLESIVERLDETGALEAWSKQEQYAWQFLSDILLEEGEIPAADLYFDEKEVQRELLRAATQLLWRKVAPKLRQGAQPYKPKERYAQGETIAHPKFGEGTVVRAVAKQIEVEFADGIKKLAHNL